jgi:hypothetical protein
VFAVHAAIVFHYNRPWAGREKLAFDAFTDAMSFFDKLAVDGRCQSPIPFMAASGGGMLVVHGEQEKLQAILQMEEFTHMYLRAGYAVPDLTYNMMSAGDSAAEMMGIWAGIGAELGLT